MNVRIIISTPLLWTMLLTILLAPVITLSAKESSASQKLDRLHIAVSSNFHTTLKLLSKLYSESHPTTITISSASTGKLTTQIRFGAPYDIFLAADERHSELLIAEELAFSDSQYTYAQGQIALIIKSTTAKSALEAIQSGDIKQLAIANPKTAPYGLVSDLWLKQSAVDSTLQRITSENIAQTWQHFQHGGVDAALVSLSQILLSKNKSYTYWLLPEKINHQLDQSVVILRSTENKQTAELFMTFLKSQAAQELITKAGYRLPR